MFSQWLFIICTLLFVGDPGTTTSTSVQKQVEEVCDASKVIRAANQYGWQVSGSSVSSYEVPAN